MEISFSYYEASVTIAACGICSGSTSLLKKMSTSLVKENNENI